MSFWKKFEEFKKQVNNVESNIYSSKKDFLEVYEKNIQLEAEIEERTQELQIANQRLLTVQHIWQMMNSSEPLTNVLDSIVNSLQGELGYLYSAIIQVKQDDEGEYIHIIADSSCDFMELLTSIFSESVYDRRINYIHTKERDECIANNKIYQSSALEECLASMFPEIERSKRLKLIRLTGWRSYIVVPLSQNNTHFGSLVVFSSRSEVTDSELTFLDLFSKQIELAITIAELFQTVKEQAITDSLTGLNNRRYFEEFLQKEVLRAQRQNQKFTIVGIDLDHLKQINDKYGHSFGDVAIRTVAAALKSNARSIDVVARMGGEEFNILLPGVDSNGGMIAAERIRKAIESRKIDTIGHVTASIGVATYLEHSDNVQELLELTDQAMYISKKNGRNRVTLATMHTKESWQDIAVDTFVELISKHRIPLDENMSERLNQRLQEISSSNDSIYSISDKLSEIYNPNHKDGITKSKMLVASLLAKRFDLSKEDTDRLKIAVLLYDIGNLMLPKDVLQKRTPLSDEEKNVIKQHPIIAAKEILKPISVVQDIIPIIENHHENWDGSGYPNKLSGENIPLESQMVLIIDAYFALIQPRPYRKAMAKDAAIEIIKEDIDKKWSKRLADEFIMIISDEQV